MNEPEKIAALLNVPRRDVTLVMAFSAALRGEPATAFLSQMTKQELVRFARANSRLRDESFALTGDRRLRVGAKPKKRTGQNEAVGKWIGSQPPDTFFMTRDVEQAVPGYTTQQTQNAISYWTRKGKCGRVKPKHGQQPAVYATPR